MWLKEHILYRVISMPRNGIWIPTVTYSQKLGYRVEEVSKTTGSGCIFAFSLAPDCCLHWTLNKKPIKTKQKTHTKNTHGFTSNLIPQPRKYTYLHRCSKVIGICFSMSNDGISFSMYRFDFLHWIYCGKYRKCMLQHHACVNIQLLLCL